MEQELLEMCDLLIANQSSLNSYFKLEETMNMAGSVLLTNRHEAADRDRLMECNDIIKESEGLLSVYRGFMRIPMIVKMSLNEDPKFYFQTVRVLKESLDDDKFIKSEYSVIAAMLIADKIKPELFKDYIRKTKMIYQKMKDEHSILTSSNDIVFAALLAVSDINVDDLLLEMEESYALLKGRFIFAETQELSHILSLDMGSPGLKVQKFLDLTQLAKEYKLPFGSGTELNSAALLSLLDLDNEEIMNQVAEMNSYLKGNKYFRGIHMFQSTRLSLAAMLLIKYCRPDDETIDSIIMYSCLTAAIAAAAAAAA